MKKGTFGKILLGGLGLAAGLVGGSLLFKNKQEDDCVRVELEDVDDVEIDADDDAE